jgi:hypothetical protein
MNDEEASDSGSERSNSPHSGNGVRPTGGSLSHNGSGALVGPVAARHLLRGGAVGSDGADDSGAELDPEQGQMMLYQSSSNRQKRMGEIEEELPPYDEDEGVGMERDHEFDSMHGGGIMGAVSEPTWSFAALNGQTNNSDMDADNDDNGSMDANLSDNEDAPPTYGPFLSSDANGEGSFQLEHNEHATLDDEDDDLVQIADSAMEDAVRQSVEVDDAHKQAHDDDTEMGH